MKLQRLLTLCLAVAFTATGVAAQREYLASKHGIRPNTGRNVSAAVGRLLSKIRSEYREGDTVVLRFEPGRYEFHEKGATQKVCYISNHDQVNPKKVGFDIDRLDNFTLDGRGADFIFHGRMLPVAVTRSANCRLTNFGVDFAVPHITQVTIVENDPQRGITFEPAPWVNYRILDDGRFESYGEGWSLRPEWGIAFEGESRRVVYNTSDVYCATRKVVELSPRRIHAPEWRDERLKPGVVVALRDWGRPAPGIFLAHNRNTLISGVRVHYAEGMGLLAQLCENITLDKFGVCLRGDDDPRYFTTQADATHFSGCKGKIISTRGLYEGMMDDAINVHGTYLKVVRRIDDRTLVGRYMHDQSWGFEWGQVGDTVQFVRSNTMEHMDGKCRITDIRPYDTDSCEGAREFLIAFDRDLDPEISERQTCGIENLSWTPEVYFAHNTIRNNRARGSLFSTPRRTVVEYNLFDHTSGAAVLLCGDCNGWFETGACREVVIRHNRFVNALTSLYQFTNAVISIYPEIPNLEGQRRYFHGGSEGAILIEDNEFDTFDAPILYAKSVDGLVFRRNVIRRNNDYKPFHPIRSRFKFERVSRVEIGD